MCQGSDFIRHEIHVFFFFLIISFIYLSANMEEGYKTYGTPFTYNAFSLCSSHPLQRHCFEVQKLSGYIFSLNFFRPILSLLLNFWGYCCFILVERFLFYFQRKSEKVNTFVIFFFLIFCVLFFGSIMISVVIFGKCKDRVTSDRMICWNIFEDFIKVLILVHWFMKIVIQMMG